MLPKISLEHLKLSKIVCGTNQFVGITHRYNFIEILAHLRRFKDPKTVAKFMIHLLQEHGINCCISSPRDKIYEAIQITQKETGEKYHWICTPSRRKTAKNIISDVYKQIDWCVDHEVSVCPLQRGYTDKAIDKNRLIIGGIDPIWPPYEEASAYIRDKGMIPGISTHYYEALQAVEKNDYDAPVIIHPLNSKAFCSNTEPRNVIEYIRKSNRQFIIIKPMAAGRIPPREGLQYALKHVKENDFIAMGFGKFEYCIENGKIVEELLKS